MMIFRLMAAMLTIVAVLTSCADTAINSLSEQEQQSSSQSADETLPQPASEPEPEQDELQQVQALLELYLEKSIDYLPLRDPDNLYNLSSVSNVRMISMLTGEYSENKTRSNYQIAGTDLGIPFSYNDEMFFAFGDSFSLDGMDGTWTNNALAVSTDFDYSDGITLDRMIMNEQGGAKELLKGMKVDHVEMTKIPTGGITIGETVYMFYMSVKHWGVPGEWECNYGSVAKSEDGGQNWTYLENLKWPGNSEFSQMHPVLIDDMIYISGITGGRGGVSRMMRVPVDQFENIEAYEYLTAVNEDGTAVFEKGALEKAYAFLPRAVGEMSIMYSDYLEEWIVTYLSGSDIIIRSAKNVWGPYSAPATLVAASDFPGLYGAFMHEAYVSEDGKKIGFMMSLWDPIYNVAVMECELVMG